MNRTDVYSVIDSERNYQDKKWGHSLSGNRPGNGERSVDEFALYIHGYSTKLLNFAAEFSDDSAKLDIVRKIAGLCVSCMEQHGANHRHE